MYDIKWIRENAAAFDQGLIKRGAEPLSAEAISRDDARKAAVAALQAAQERRNALSKEIGQAMAKKDVALAESLKAEVARLKEGAGALEQAEREADTALSEFLAAIPNMPAADVPVGADEHGNALKSTHGEKPALTFQPKEHFELGEALGMMDFEAAAKMSGARFVVLKGPLARLERAIGQFFLDTHTAQHGYTEVNPPLLVRDEAMFGTAQLPKFEEDQFQALSMLLPRKTQDFFARLAKTNEKLQKLDQEKLLALSRALAVMFDAIDRLGADIDRIQIEKLKLMLAETFSEFEVDVAYGRLVELELAKITSNRFWLVPTAEVPLTNLAREQILDSLAEPLRYTALTPCFRAEAGSAGRDTRGMLRQHQFMKCELVSITAPEQSAAEHERMLACAEAVLKALGLHYRVMTLCTGDMGFASTKTYDIEVWLPGQGAYREISSCSNCGDFQARRMNARMRGADGKPQFVHTLNGSGVAVGRALIAVMENYQEADGAITVPEVLRPYMGGLTRIARG